MIEITENKYLIKLKRIFFPKDIVDSNGCDLYRYLRVKRPLGNKFGVLEDTVLTVITTLVQDELLLQNMSKNVRYEIKRSAERDNVIIEYYDALQLEGSKQIIEDFFEVYKNFCEMSNQPQLIQDFDLGKISDYIENRCIVVSKVCYDKGKTFHMYVYDQDNALLIYSASDFRNDSVDRNVAGRANKLLHFRDLQFFRENGLTSYDWGNVTSFDHPNGIDVFKISFGGEQVLVYNIFVGRTLKGKLLVEAKKILDRLRRKA